MIFQCGSTLRVSIEVPVISRHCLDMTERLLKGIKPKLNKHKRLEKREVQKTLSARCSSPIICCFFTLKAL